MEALRIVKTLENIELSELKPYLGQKVELIIRPLEKMSVTERKAKAFEIMNRCSGRIKRWTRDEVYDR
jgi:hypothetical protein